MNATTGRRTVHIGEVVISLVLVMIGSFVIYETQGIAETQGYSQVGPRLFPYIIGTGLTLCGAVLGWHAMVGGWRNVPLDQPEHDAPDWMAFAIISVGIVLHMVLIGWAGFIIASTLMFVLIARGFGSKRSVRDVLIGLAISVAAYFLFTMALGLRLPPGPFGGD
jgi:putative tricarboxylic transport membrane protein